SAMADFVFTNQISDSTDRTPSTPQQDIVITNVATETTTPEVDAVQVKRRRLRSAARLWG
nr:hypothetical protein [Tanacetum cinerariifolium]